jgi:hypothetical protein
LKRTWLFVLIALALVAGAALVACGGGNDNENNKPAATAVEDQGGNGGGGEAEATTAPKDTPKPSTGGGSSGSLGDIPIYPGASKVSSGEYSGSDAAIPMIGSDVDASNYNSVQWGIYETSDSADDVYNWYKDKMSDWHQEWSYSGGDETGAGAMVVWTKDSGKEAAWVIISEDSGTTELSIWYGS